MQTNTTLFENVLIYGLLLLIGVAMAGGCSHPVGTDCNKPFLIVESATDTMDAQPSISLTNIGDEPVYVSGIGFVLRADDDLTVNAPSGCNVLYEDMVDERILRISCFGDAEIEVPPNEEVIVDIDVQGPWSRLDLVSVISTDETGEPVWNDISSAFNGPSWNNPTYN
ncbi:hypothetical protein ACFL10_01695 [Patescibacteria group bacterium]